MLNPRTFLHVSLFSIVSMLVLSGCSWLADWPPSDFGSQSYDFGYNQAEPPTSHVKVMQTTDGTWVEADPRPRRVRHEGEINYERQQAEIDDRLTSLEQDFKTLNTNFKRLLPSLQHLVRTQDEMKDILERIEPRSGPATRAHSMFTDQVASLASEMHGQTMPEGGVNVEVPSQNAAVVSMKESVTPQQAAYKMPAPRAGQPVVETVRFGEHANKTRIVLDATESVSFNYDVNNDRGLLMIEIPGAAWTEMPQKQIGKSPLVASYKAMPNGAGGTQLAIQLKAPVRVDWAQVVPAANALPDRLVLDISRLR